MKVKFSPLKLKQFELLESQFKFNVPKEGQVDVSSLFESYSVDIDFVHHFPEENTIQVFVKVKVNNLKKPKPGYVLFSEGMGIFEIQKSDSIDEKLSGNLRFYSTLNMMINNLRNIMYQISNLGPMGGYLLPPIDVLDLFKKKENDQGKQFAEKYNKS